MHRERAAITGSPIRPRLLALLTLSGCAVALILSALGDSLGSFDAGGWYRAGNWSMVLAQALWNGTQVGLLALLLCLWLANRGWYRIALMLTAAALLPFAIYLGSPGAWAMTGHLAITCLSVLLRGPEAVTFTIADPVRRRSGALCSLELLALICNLLCSMYNFTPSQNLVPYWASIFSAVESITGFAAGQAVIAETLYSAGLGGVEMPSAITIGVQANALGALIYVGIWSILPFVYALYFGALAMLARHSPGTGVQRAICALCIVHFLFLTDIVDHRFGRGLGNPAGHLAHWAEVFAWRVAIILPIYQKLTSRHWLDGNGRLGYWLHYALLVWVVFFFVWEVALLDIPRFLSYIFDFDFTPIRMFGYRPEILGYNGSLVLMVLLYGFTLLALRTKHIFATIGSSGRSHLPGSQSAPAM